MSYSNGRIPQSALAKIPGGYLRRDAANAWNAMVREARSRGMAVPMPSGPASSYRTYDQQVYFWNLYRSGRGNPAAQPSTSNHGWGVAVDVTQAGWRTMRSLGPKYGFSNVEGARVGEAWHWSNPRGARAVFRRFKRGLPVLRPGAKGPSVVKLQGALRALGFKTVPRKGWRGYGSYGRTTRSAVRRFQRAHKLKADAIIGPSTWRALRRAVR